MTNVKRSLETGELQIRKAVTYRGSNIERNPMMPARFVRVTKGIPFVRVVEKNGPKLGKERNYQVIK